MGKRHNTSYSNVVRVNAFSDDGMRRALCVQVMRPSVNIPISRDPISL